MESQKTKKQQVEKPKKKNIFLRLKDKLVKFIKSINKENILNLLKRAKENFLRVVSFVVLLNAYLLMRIFVKVINFSWFPADLKLKIQPPVEKTYFKLVRANRYKEDTINRVNLIEIALKNMGAKRTRTLITIGGMSVGIAAIVFLVSVGYGLQELVTSRVARLEEMQQCEVSTQPGSNVRITSDTIDSFNEFEEVEKTLPLIALVGRINYRGSVSDMAVYGVTTEYINNSAIKTVKGKVFDSNELGYGIELEGEVAGITTSRGEYGSIIRDVEFSMKPGEWVAVREEPRVDAKLLGYTQRTAGQHTGVEYWGGDYDGSTTGISGKDHDNNYLGKWVKSKFFIWQVEGRQYIKEINDYGYQDQKDGYITENHLELKNISLLRAEVLGLFDSLTQSTETTESTSSAETIIDLGEGWVLIEDESASLADEIVQTIPLAENAKKQAVVNRAVIQVLGLDENEAIGSTFEMTYVVPADLLENSDEKIESEPEIYEIVGLIPVDDTAYMYVPFIDLKGLGVFNYSQLKVIANSERDLPHAREKIEAMGYITTSVTDTVEQIDNLFSTVRTILAILGAVALMVASLGMFNTLTVSLLERTREIGLMKAMGMKSIEVEELFLTESMVMGFFGGILGLIMGIIAGKVLGLLLSFIAVFKGVGFIDISHMPLGFTLLIIVLSLFVGIVTGIYPAKRATKISALNALRYE
jgi:ABC-type antimicrobial peptide transport system permease subunit